MFKCIYCKKSSPDVTPSISHIIPDGFGIGPTLNNAVCANCNHQINQEIENPIIQSLALLRNMLGIEGRHGKPRFKAQAKFLDAILDVHLRTPEELDKSLFFFKLGKDSSGKNRIAIIGDKNKILETQKAYEQRHPNTIWIDTPPNTPTGIDFKIEMDFDIFATQKAHRLASKIAFEYYCLKRSPEIVTGYEFDEIRNYILSDESASDLCRIVINPTVLVKFQSIPFSIHAVYLDQNLNSPKIIVLVGVFGLIYYRVILKRLGSGLGTDRRLYLINPQNGEYKPIIHGLAHPPNLHGQINLGPPEPEKALKSIFPQMLKKLNSSIEEMYASAPKD